MMTRDEFAAALQSHDQEVLKFRRRMPIFTAIFFAWLGVVYLSRPINSSQVKFGVLMGVFPFAFFLLVWSAARQIDKNASARGLRCPKCKRWQWGLNGLHALKTSKCKWCDQQLTEDENVDNLLQATS